MTSSARSAWRPTAGLQTANEGRQPAQRGALANVEQAKRDGTWDVLDAAQTLASTSGFAQGQT